MTNQARVTPIDALARFSALVREASAESFAGVMADGLAAALRSAALALLEDPMVVSPWREQITHFMGGLDRFEERGVHDRSRVVAHGLRIAAGLRAQAPVSAAPRAPARDLGPPRPATSIAGSSARGANTREREGARAERAARDGRPGRRP
jgi:ATP-dependent DNA helicase RecG